MYAIRTKSWCLRTSATDTDDMSAGEYPASASDATSQQFELFVRPDDRWEANDVSKLCPDVVEELQAAASEFLKRIEAGDTFATSQ